MKRLNNLNVVMSKAAQLGPPGCGSMLHVDGIVWISPKKARVIGGNIFSICDGLCPAMGLYDVLKANNTWKVLRFAIWSDMEWYPVF
jgi:hypothetical protein